MTVTATVENSIADKLLEWPDKLRSGEYQQTSGHLKDDVGHCCIGVLDDIVFNPKWRKLDESEPHYFDDNLQSAMLVPDASAKVGLSQTITQAEVDYIQDYFKEVELESSVTDFKPGQHRQITLTMLNDRGATFQQIADVVEALNWHKVDEGQGAI